MSKQNSENNLMFMLVLKRILIRKLILLLLSCLLIFHPAERKLMYIFKITNDALWRHICLSKPLLKIHEIGSCTNILT